MPEISAKTWWHTAKAARLLSCPTVQAAKGKARACGPQRQRADGGTERGAAKNGGRRALN